MVAEGDKLRAEVQYESALAKYKEAKEKGALGLDDKIRQCEEAIALGRLSFEDYLSKAQMSSLKAFEGYLKKWKRDKGDFSDNQKQQVKQKVSDHITGLAKSKAKDWVKFDINKI